jgi:DNA-binding NtrC family response regulator
MLAPASLTDGLDVRALPVAAGTAVLVVDDDDALRKLLALRLRLLGHEVETASSVPAAIETLETRGIGAVLSDHSMPEASGLELLAYVARRRPGIPFVLMTGQLTAELEEDALAGGAALVLDKADLLEALPDLFLVLQHERRSAGFRADTSQEIHRKRASVHRRLAASAASLSP